MTTKTKPQSKVSLAVRRLIPASPERVFDAWLDPHQAAQWLFATPNGKMLKAEIDPRVGGHFNFTERREGEDVEHVGRYLEIKRPRLLAFTFAVPKFSKDETKVTIELVKKRKGCELSLTHEGVLTEWADKSKEGWGKILAALENSVSEASPASEREIVITRVLDAPRERVWKALTDPKEVDSWWGPNGFKNITKSWDFQPGGLWKHVMIGPDGAEYPNTTKFVEIVKPDHIVYANAGGKKGGRGVSFQMTWSLKDLGGKTELTIHQVFKTAEERDFVANTFKAIEGGKQTLGRLNDYLAKEEDMTTKTRKPAFELKLERVVDAPVARVWKAWEDPKQVAKWFAPRPYTLSVEKMDLRTGGSFSMAMHAPDGQTHAFSGVYPEIIPLSKIVWTGEFPGDPKNNIRTEINFEAVGNRTKIHVRQTFNVLTPINEQATKGAKQGWTMTLDQLAEIAESR